MRAAIFGCLLAGLVAVTLADEKMDVNAIGKACMPESKASEKEVNDFWTPNANLDAVTMNMKCQLKCIMEKMGSLKGGMFDADKAAKNSKEIPELKAHNINEKAFVACKNEKGENDCETAFKITKCLRQFKA